MLRTFFIAMYKILGVLGMAGLRPPAELLYGSAE